MKEVKPSKKPLAIYYAIVLLVLLVESMFVYNFGCWCCWSSALWSCHGWPSVRCRR